MDITSDLIFKTIEKKFKKKENNEKNNILTNGIILNHSKISSFIFNSKEPNIIYNFENLEYLSLTYNYLRNIDFIEYLPNIFYLDLFNNSIDDFTPLNKKNIFGYLRLSIDRFTENKILQINGLTIAIFDIEIKDIQLIKNIVYNNPNIIMINNNINYIIDKIISKEQSKKTGRRISVMKQNSDIFAEQENNKNEHLNIKNNCLLSLKKFYSRYTKRIERILNVKMINTSLALKEYKEYLDIERNKLILLNDCYNEISRFNYNMNNFYISNINSIYENKKINDILFYGLGDKLKKNKAKGEDSLKVTLIILTCLLFLLMDLISKEMGVTILNIVLEKYFQIKKEDLIPLNLNFLYSIALISIYYQLYDEFIQKFDVENIKNVFYKEIIKILSMEKLILKANILNNNIETNKNILEKSKLLNKKTIVKNKVKFINNLDILEEFIILIQFLYDYIIYEKIDKIFLNNDISSEYILFIEFKELIEQSQVEKTQNISLIDKKLNKIHIDILHQQFYFEQEKVKFIRNKNFPERPKQIRVIKTYYNYDNDYYPHDDIEINDLFKVKKVRKKNSLSIEDLTKVNSIKTNFPQIRSKSYNLPNETTNGLNYIKEKLNDNSTKYIINNEITENKEKNKERKSNHRVNKSYDLMIKANTLSLNKRNDKIEKPDFYTVKGIVPLSMKFSKKKSPNKSLNQKSKNFNSFLSVTRFNEEELRKKLYANRKIKKINIHKPIKLGSLNIETI